MMSTTHVAFSVSLTSIVLGTANPGILGVSAIASLLPDIDTSKSFIGRLFFPLSRWIETRTVHRGITHSFFATGMITLITYPLAAVGYSIFGKHSFSVTSGVGLLMSLPNQVLKRFIPVEGG